MKLIDDLDSLEFGIYNCIYLKRGRLEALPASFIAKRFRITRADVNVIVHKLRAVYNIPICSCHDGYFYPRNIDEIRQTEAHLKSRLKNQAKAVKGFLKGVDREFNETEKMVV